MAENRQTSCGFMSFCILRGFATIVSFMIRLKTTLRGGGLKSLCMPSHDRRPLARPRITQKHQARSLKPNKRRFAGSCRSRVSSHLFLVTSPPNILSENSPQTGVACLAIPQRDSVEYSTSKDQTNHTAILCSPYVAHDV